MKKHILISAMLLTTTSFSAEGYKDYLVCNSYES